MEYIVGVTLALAVCGAAALLRMDRDRVFYPAMLIAVASYYVAFAVVDGGSRAMASEVAIAAVFVVLAVIGFKRSSWLVAAALAGHGLMDLYHHLLVANSGVPPAWPGFCAAFDLTAGAFLGCLIALRQRHVQREATVPGYLRL